MRIVHYFSPMSGYAYLGFGELCAVAERCGALIEHRPVDIQQVFAATDTVAPAKQSPARLAWRRTDMLRWAERRSLPLNAAPRHWPVDASLAARAIIAAGLGGFGQTALAEAILAAVWARDLTIACPDILAGLARECGLDAAAILALADGTEAHARYAQNTQDAIAAGVFGSPTVFIGEDMYFGQDRLDFVERALAPAREPRTRT